MGVQADMEVSRTKGEYNLVIIRHGESDWNKDNRFTGWRDVKLSERGIMESREAGRLLHEDRFDFDVAFTSVLRRSIHTLWLVLEEMNLMWIPEHKSWRLNERHYGALQGKNKIEAVRKYGEAQVQQWRRGFDVRPPLADRDSLEFPRFDPRYDSLAEHEVPRGESLKDVMLRVIPYWESMIVPEIRDGKKVLVVAHGNSLRALVKHIEGLTDAQIVEVNLPTGIPLVYELDENLKATSDHFHGDPDEVYEKIKSVVSQTQQRPT